MSDEENPVEEAPWKNTRKSPTFPQTETLLREVSAPVSIELGRLQLNASEVARLKQGQILKLPRNSDDPVNLVVDNEVFAQGELKAMVARSSNLNNPRHHGRSDFVKTVALLVALNLSVASADSAIAERKLLHHRRLLPK